MPFREDNQFALAAVEKHLAESRDHISRMKGLVTDGERRGFDMTEAKVILAQFLVAHVKREVRRKQLLTQLDTGAP